MVVAPKEKETKVIPSLFSSSFGVGGKNWRWTNTAFFREKRLTGMMWRKEKKGLFSSFFCLSVGGAGGRREVNRSEPMEGKRIH